METPEEQESSFENSQKRQEDSQNLKKNRERGKNNVLYFSRKVKKNESIIDLSGFCWVFSIIKSAFRNIYIC